MNFDDILLEILNEFIDGKKVNIDGYCQKYPDYKEAIIAKFRTAEFIKKSFREEDLSGKKLGDYLILQELGRGGMGIVFLGIQPALSRLTAIKVLPPSFSSDKETLRNFQEEAKIIAKFNHPNIVPIYSISNEKDVYYIAMGYIAGPSLKNIIETIQKNKQSHHLQVSIIKEILQVRPFEEKHILQKSIALKRGLKFWDKTYFQFVATIGVEVADALSYAHQNGIIHGDLKPSNILLTNEGMPMLVDFGLSKDIKKLATSKSNEFTGTLAYAAPEQIKENTINEKTDIWSLGVTLYELLSFNNPFREDTVKKTVEKITKSYIPSLRSYDKKIPWELEAIVSKCLEKEPENRYNSVVELATDLNGYLESKPIKAKEINIASRTYLRIKRHPTMTSVLVVLFISLIAASSYIYLAKLNNLINKAAELRLKGEFKSAQKIYEQILRIPTITPLTKTIREKAFLGMGDLIPKDHTPIDALPYYEKCLQLNPKNILALYGKKMVYENMGNEEKVTNCLMRILEISPFDFVAVQDYARLLRKKGEVEAALNFLAEKCRDNEVAEYPLVSFEISYLVEDLFTKLKLNKSSFDDYYKIKKILRHKGFNKKTIEPAIDKVMFVNVEVTFNVIAIKGNEPLKNLAIEKGIIPEHTDENYINTNRKNRLKMWLISDALGKAKIVDSMKEYFKNNGVIIKRPSNYYVAMINIQITPIFKNNVYNPRLGYEWDNNFLLVALKNAAIILGDYDNGRNKLELLKEVMGEKEIEKLKQDQPDKYEDFLNE